MKTIKAKNGEIKIGTYYETEPKWAIFKTINQDKEIFYGQIENLIQFKGFVNIEEKMAWNRNYSDTANFKIKLSEPYNVIVLKNSCSINGQMITKLNN